MNSRLKEFEKVCIILLIFLTHQVNNFLTFKAYGYIV